jgi:hypothetical protein
MQYRNDYRTVKIWWNSERKNLSLVSVACSPMMCLFSRHEEIDVMWTCCVNVVWEVNMFADNSALHNALQHEILKIYLVVFVLDPRCLFWTDPFVESFERNFIWSVWHLNL